MDTVQYGGSLAEQLSTEGSGCSDSAKGSVVWEQLGHSAPAESPYQAGWLLNCLRVCVLNEYLYQCALVQRYVHQCPFLPQTVCPFLFLFKSYTAPLFLTQCLFPVCLYVCLSARHCGFRRPIQPHPPLSVLPAAFLSHFTPACHIPSYLRGNYIHLP